MILIPLSGSGTRGDQVENAAYAARAGAALVLRRDDLSPSSFVNALKKYLEPERYAEAVGACRALTSISNARIADGSFLSSADFIAQLILAHLSKWQEPIV